MRFMKKSLLILFLVSLVLCEVTNAQCGLTPKYSILSTQGTYSWQFATNNVLSPNWKVYAYEWTNDGQVFSTGANPWVDMPNKLNLVCLKEWATDTITNDSCEVSYCNVLLATTILPLEIHVDNPSGNTVDFEGYSGPYLQGGTFDFGDGTSGTNVDIDSHTYATSGDYNVTYSLGFGIPQGSTSRKVHVGNGYPNINAINASISVLQTTCDSVRVMITSTPPFTTGTATVDPYGGLPNQRTISNGNYVYVPYGMEVIPGSYAVEFELRDAVSPPNQGIIHQTGVFTVDICANASPDTVGGYVFEDTDADGIWDSGESAIPNFMVFIDNMDYHAMTDSTGYYQLLVPATDVFIRTNQPDDAITFPLSNSYTVNFNSGSFHGPFNFGLADLDLEICGKVFIDYDQNGYLSAGDDRLANCTVKALNTLTQEAFFTTTNAVGNYCFNLSGGNMVITPIYSLIDSIYFTPDTIFVNAQSGTFNSNDFAAFCTLPGSDPEITMHTYPDPRPGFTYVIGTNVFNSGIDSSNSTVVFNYDPILDYDFSAPTGSVDLVNHTITWNTGMIKAGKGESFSARFLVPAITPLGTLLNNNSTVTINSSFTDIDSTNNYSAVSNVVVGSFDPNDKNVNPAGANASGDVHHETRLHYRINFQNTGTASAVNVLVQDEVDDDLNMNTFMVERMSHFGVLSTFDRQLSFNFLNINLPDSNTNEPGSHGFIEYSIVPIQGLPDGVTIENTASIYFDYNTPVLTNTTLNTLQTNITTIHELEAAFEFDAFPIPFDDHLNVRIMFASDQLIINLIDVTGRKLFTEKYKSTSGELFSIPTRGLSQGLYFLEIYNGTNKFVKKVMK